MRLRVRVLDFPMTHGVVRPGWNSITQGWHCWANYDVLVMLKTRIAH